jgi:uncharacterized membrane protein YcaP (DUF421 family)
MTANPHVLLEILLRTSAIYLLILIGVRLSGKREVGQMTPFDLTLLLLLANAVQNAMTGPDTSLAGGAVAATTLLVLNFVVADFAGLNRRFRKFVQGEPTLLIHNGRLIPAHLAREHLTVDEVMRALREHGISRVEDVSLAVLEVDGSVSCLKYDDVGPQHSHHPRLRFLQKHQ